MRRHRYNDGDDKEMRRQPNAEIGKAGSNDRAEKRSPAEGSMQLRHDGAPQLVLDVGALNIDGDIPEPNSDTEYEK